MFLESHGIGQVVEVDFHPVTGFLQMLTRVMVDSKQSIHEVHHAVGRTFLLIGGKPK
jgi:hypothetical protein